MYILGIVKRNMRDMTPNNADELKAAIEATWASITPQQGQRLINSMHLPIDAVLHAKKALDHTEKFRNFSVHQMNHSNAMCFLMQHKIFACVCHFCPVLR